MVIFAADLSLTATGYAVARDGVIEKHGLILGKGSDVGRLIHNRDRFMEMVESVQPELVIMEDLAQSRNMSFAKENAGMAYMIRSELYSDGLKYVMVQASSLKKFVVGTAGSKKNKVTKDLVIRDVYKRWGHDIDSNDVADAIVLAYIGMAMVGDRPPEIEPQRQVLAGLMEKNPHIRMLLKPAPPVLAVVEKPHPNLDW